MRTNPLKTIDILERFTFRPSRFIKYAHHIHVASVPTDQNGQIVNLPLTVEFAALPWTQPGFAESLLAHACAMEEAAIDKAGTSISLVRVKRSAVLKAALIELLSMSKKQPDKEPEDGEDTGADDVQPDDGNGEEQAPSAEVDDDIHTT